MSSDDSTKIKKLEKVIENLLKADENREEEMVGLKQKKRNEGVGLWIRLK